MTKVIVQQDYHEFLVHLKASIRQYQYQAMHAVNRELLALYGKIGQAIHQKQQELGWGKAIVETLAQDLQAEFPGRNGFSARNLWNMRDFYLACADMPKLQPLVAEISWTKNLVILGRCKAPLPPPFFPTGHLSASPFEKGGLKGICCTRKQHFHPDAILKPDNAGLTQECPVWKLQ